jgi:molybdenum cofactor synthesis domain-containing protein
MFQNIDIKEANKANHLNKLNIDLSIGSKRQAFNENNSVLEAAAPALKKIHIKDAVGTVLAHDLTRIIPGKLKGPAYRKGHIVQKNDIVELLKMGKEHLYVLDLSEGLLHEDDAALRIANAVCGDNLSWTAPKEGKSSIFSTCDGLLKIDVELLLQINRMDDIIVATLKNSYPCKKDQIVAATRIIPLVIPEDRIVELERISCGVGPILQIRPFRKLKFGGVVTGSEIYSGLIKDSFDEFVAKKAQQYGCEMIKKVVVPDDTDAIANAINELCDLGCELILTTGGLSVDPDDVTRQGVRKCGARIINYGSPVLPGAMALYAERDNIPILGLPACVFYHRTTIYDILLPRILAYEPITKDTFAKMGHGGLCLDCEECRYPACPFAQ